MRIPPAVFQTKSLFTREKLAWKSSFGCLACFLLGVGTMWGGEQPGVRIGFEPGEEFSAGPLPVGRGWEKREGADAQIDAGEKATGSQSLKLAPAGGQAAVTFASSALPAGGIRFLDLRFQPVAQGADRAETALSVWGSTLGFVKTEGKFGVVVVGEPESRLVCTEAEAASPRWLRLTVRQDLAHKTWDLYVDGRLVAVGQPLELAGLGELTLFANEESAVWIDDLSGGKANPLFEDIDQDGMPDAEEIANGLNPYIDDRLGDVDGDGVSNIEEMLRGTPPRAGPGEMALHGSVLYVDNLHGSDAANGKRSYPVGGDGPKASIKGAMAAAQSGDTIIIMPGKGLYDEGSRGAPGKRLTIKTLAHVTIK